MRPDNHRLTGSPPPMRGKVTSGRIMSQEIGITPAYAGKRNHGVRGFSGRQDHPRLCGEKVAADHERRNVVGSPPPMRGKAGRMMKNDSEDRITPAYAGKRQTWCGGCCVWGDHPRLCGEKGRTLWVQSPKQGSPPPMRGKENACVTDESNIGITPAYAGKSHLS